MHTLPRVALAIALLGTLSVAFAADPPKLVAPVVPASGAVRARLPLGDPKSELMQLKAQIPKPKGKKGEMIDILVTVSVHPAGPITSLQQWKAWGFELTTDHTGILPELVIPGAQLSPKLAKGRDVELHLSNLKMNLQEAAGGEKAGLTNGIGIALHELSPLVERLSEPRVYFADRFLELTVPGTAIKKLNSGDVTSPEPQVTKDDKLVPAYLAFTGSGYPSVSFVSVNGQTQFITPQGNTRQVAAGMASGGLAPGIMMSVSMARGCGVELDREMHPTSGKVKELRFGMLTGPGYKNQKDLVLKDVTVLIHAEESTAFIWLAPAFADTYFKDGIYGCAADGFWRLHGRVKAELLEDPKTRKPVVPKKP